MNKYEVYWKDSETMTNSLAMDAPSAQIMTSKCHVPLKAVKAGWQNGWIQA